MQNPYDRYMSQQSQMPKKKKQKIRQKTKARKTPVGKSRGQKTKSEIDIPWSFIGMSFFGLALSLYVFTYTDEVLTWASRIEVSLTQSIAADEEKSADPNEEKGKKDSSLPAGQITQPSSDADQLTMQNTSIYKALKDKRRELEKKERRLAQLEEELQIQKVEIEKQLKEMQEMRRNISSKLDKKVVADQENIDKLVGVYSNMKPQNAALILTQIDDDLAVKVLGKMKKQSAAAILNYVEPKKAQYLSEKFTGLKK